MDFFSKQRVIAWTIAILIILNLGALATLWVHHFRQPPASRLRGHGPPARARDFLNRELGFTGNQKEELEKLQIRQLLQIDALHKETADLKRRMMDKLLKSSSDSGKIDELAGEIGEIEAQKARLIYRHLEEIKSLCTLEQRARFNGLIRELLEIMKPPGPPDRRHGGRHPTPEGERRERDRGRMDADGDGKVSTDEWAKHHREVFRVKIDLNGDGYASETEWRDHHEKRQRPL